MERVKSGERNDIIKLIFGEKLRTLSRPSALFYHDIEPNEQRRYSKVYLYRAYD